MINRIIATAHTPAQGLNNTLGAGIVDAVAALTANVPKGDPIAPGVPSAKLPPPAAPAPPDHTARNIAWIALGVGATVLIVISIAVFARGNSRT